MNEVIEHPKSAIENPREKLRKKPLTTLLIRYHELALKGDNRIWFENLLVKNIRKMLLRSETPFEKQNNDHRSSSQDKKQKANILPASASISDTSPAKASLNITKRHGRIFLETDANWNDSLNECLSRVFGISSFSVATPVATNLEAIFQICLRQVTDELQRSGSPDAKENHKISTFCVRSRRSDKAIPLSSMDIDRWIGSRIHDAFPHLKVALKGADLVVGVEVRNDLSYVWTQKNTGHGGLPTGSNGSVLTLLSGGLDSPVAAINTLRRGSSSSFVHFYGTPFVGEEALTKVIELARLINLYQPDPRPLYVIPFGAIQEKIALTSSPKMRTILYRRMMIRIACEIASRVRAKALITGESLGQVASQTLENLSVINAVSDIPILRPLITLTKEEIIEQAHQWKTYETSIEPAADCCTLFADRHPALRSTPESVEKEESKVEAVYPWKDLMAECLANARTITF